jgi:hypothetical protein
MAKQRRPAWQEWTGRSGPGRLAVFPRVPPLTDNEGWAGVKSDISEMAMQPRLIVIDTLSRLMAGFDENQSKDVTAATNFMEDLSRFYECFVLFVHHTGKDESKGARGSTALFANVDTVISTSRKGAGTFLKARKHKDADTEGDAEYLKVRPFANSIILEKAEAPMQQDPKKSNKISWSDPSEITSILMKNAGKMSAMHLSQEIASLHGLDRIKVAGELRNRQDIQWLRDNDTWRIPSEYDL